MGQKKCIFKIVLQYLKLYKKIKTYLQYEKAMIQKNNKNESLMIAILKVNC